MLRVRINWTGLNTGFSVWHFDGPDTQTGANDAAAAAATWCGAVDNFLRVNQAWAIDPEVQQVSVLTGQVEAVYTVTGGSGTGADSGDAVPNAAMILVRWRTGVFLSGRELRGRTFIPGCTETSVDANGNLGSTAIAAINTANATLISGSEFGIYSPTKNAYSDASSGSTWSEFAVLRSRRE